MKFIVQVALTIILTYFLELYFPWWVIFIVPMGVSIVIPNTSLSSFLSGFLGIGILWSFLAWKIDIDSHSFFSSKISELFSIPTHYLFITSGIIGAVCGGLGALVGNSFIKIFRTTKKSKY
ncbi:MAG: hypothetical protein QM536_06405 [Chitinophagaceae bacterium]|nr:hypothetical protein [Chitinophagaceae bacterium]